MKKYLVFTLAAIALTITACGENTEKKAAASAVEASSAKAVSNSPVMTFDKTIHDFGNIREGERVETVFTFTNNGDTGDSDTGGGQDDIILTHITHPPTESSPRDDFFTLLRFNCKYL